MPATLVSKCHENLRMEIFFSFWKIQLMLFQHTETVKTSRRVYMKLFSNKIKTGVKHCWWKGTPWMITKIFPVKNVKFGYICWTKYFYMLKLLNTSLKLILGWFHSYRSTGQNVVRRRESFRTGRWQVFLKILSMIKALVSTTRQNLNNFLWSF